MWLLWVEPGRFYAVTVGGAKVVLCGYWGWSQGGSMLLLGVEPGRFYVVAVDGARAVLWGCCGWNQGGSMGLLWVEPGRFYMVYCIIIFVMHACDCIY